MFSWITYTLLLSHVLSISAADVDGLNILQSGHRQRDKNAEKSLIRLLLDRYAEYGVIGRPVNDSRVKLVVNYGLQLIQLLGLDENKQVLRTNCWTLYRWNDALLRWNPSEYGNISQLSIFPHHIWTPDIKLYNSADERMQEYRKGQLVVTSGGEILWMRQALFKSTCQIEITYFPFDSQVCMLEFGSMTYDRTQLDLEWWIREENSEPMPYVDFSDYVPANDWYTDGEADLDITETSQKTQLRSVKLYRLRGNTVGDQRRRRCVTVLRYLIRLDRYPSFHLFTLVLPCLLLSLLTLVVFWLPPDSSAKMMLGINIFLAFFVLLLLLTESMPKAVRTFPVIGVIFCLNMIMITFSTFLATIVVNLFYRGYSGEPLPSWVRKIFLGGFGKVVCLPRQFYRKPMKTRRPKPWTIGEPAIIGPTTKVLSTQLDETQPTESLKLTLLHTPGMLACLDEVKQVTDDVTELGSIQARAEHRQQVTMEWSTLAMVVDRIFFFIYLVIMVVTFTVVVCTTKPVDMKSILTAGESQPVTIS